ncbi:MAG: type I-U CRISPR-associated protein Cas8c [Enhygromyxa sp.]
MTLAKIPVDLLNPGQVFGCIGILEAARQLGKEEVVGGFDWREPGTSMFIAECAGDVDPVTKTLDFLARAQVSSVVSNDSELNFEKWDIPTRRLGEVDPLPYREPSSPAAAPALLEADGKALMVTHWGDTTVRDNVKFWAGAGGYPGAGLLRDALALIRDNILDAMTDPFGLAAPQSSSFRFEWRRDYVPLDVGFSLNNHSGLVPLGYPLTEVLAAIGLTHARPHRPDRRDKLHYRYGVIGGADATTYPLPLLRAALGCAQLPFPTRTFNITLDWPGKEGQARCITAVAEET